MSRNALLAALALPLLVIALGIVRAELQLAHGQRWVFDVQGYDPRDLLRGHYIAYRLRLDEDDAAANGCKNDDPACCLCLETLSSGEPPRITRESCPSASTHCGGVLQTKYLSQLRRYYVPEQNAPALTARFQTAANAGKARLVVAIDKSGKPQVESLLIDGQRIDQK